MGRASHQTNCGLFVHPRSAAFGVGGVGASARLASADRPASQLKVRFAPAFLTFLPFVWADYWVIDLADDYSYAVVGHPNHEYLWILSRSPSMVDSLYQEIVANAAIQGFDVDRLVRTPQESAQ